MLGASNRWLRLPIAGFTRAPCVASFGRTQSRTPPSRQSCRSVSFTEVNEMDQSPMRTLLQLTRRLMIGLVWLYCLGVIVLAVVWLAGVQGIWWLDLANVFALWLFAPLLLLAPII